MRNLISLIVIGMLPGCAGDSIPNQPRNIETFKTSEKTEAVDYANKNILAEFETETEPVYRLGEGDKINVQVWNRPELSGKHTVGPDGKVTVPMIGTMRLTTMTREEASSSISTKLERYYNAPIVNLSIDEYQANRVTILGRVLTPGILHFDNPPMLLDALARAGSLPMLDKQTTLTRCAIFRGREKIIWVDLKPLLERGDLAYNIRLKPNDLIYIPDVVDAQIYVLGAVQKPGSYHLSRNMSLLDALAQAGGPNEDGNSVEVSIYRPSRNSTERVPLQTLLTADRKANYALEDGDVLYVPKKGVAEVGYVMRQLLPGLSFMMFGFATGIIK